jgi:hypothetical protein
MLQLFTIQFFIIINIIKLIIMNIHYILGTMFIVLFITNLYILYNELTNIYKKPNKMGVNYILN